MEHFLAYVHDPMCSWCYAFRATHKAIIESVSGSLAIRRLLGGLAADTTEPMPAAMQTKLQQTWQRIEETVPGTEFNYSFWKECAPRRATYPACRAVIAAKAQADQFDSEMTNAIQNAYYREARNPSDDETLIALAGDIGLDTERFAVDLNAEHTQQVLLDEISTARSIGISSYPSMAVVSSINVRPIELSYTQPQLMIEQITSAVRELA